MVWVSQSFALWRIISPHFCKNQCSFNGAGPGKQRWTIRVVTCDGLRVGPIRIFSGTLVELQVKTTIFSSFGNNRDNTGQELPQAIFLPLEDSLLENENRVER